jgi:hypothetical protein
MLISLTTLLATLSSIFRSRAALEFENLALRHQIGVVLRQNVVHLNDLAHGTIRSFPIGFLHERVAGELLFRLPKGIAFCPRV